MLRVRETSGFLQVQFLPCFLKNLRQIDNFHCVLTGADTSGGKLTNLKLINPIKQLKKKE
jgi:hypothetical protein